MANLSSYISTNTPASLNDLSDLSTSGASTGEVLSVNSDGTFSFIAIGGGTTSYNTIGDLPLVDNDTGDTAFVTANNKLYVWNGSGWYAIATVNETPTWDSGSSPESTYTVPNDGSSLTITLAASDPEGFPITYTAVTDSEFEAFAEITQNSDDSFTVTKLSSATQSATGTVTFKASDGVNIVSNVSTFTITFVAEIEDSKYTSLLLTSVGSNGGTNGSVTDGSTNSRTVTVNGNSSLQTYSPYRSGGYSYYFDGSGDYLSIVDDSMTQTGEFTVELWFYSPSASEQVLFHWSDISDSKDNDLTLLSTGAIQCRIGTGGSTKSTSSSSLWSVNTWHHIAAVRDSSNTVKVYLDGNLIINHGVQTDDMDNTLEIGRNPYNGGGSYLTGYIRDFRIDNTANYTSNFTVSEDLMEVNENTKLLTCHLPYLADGSTNSYTVTSVGNVSTKPFTPYDYEEYDTATHGGSIYFDGDTDYLSIPTSTDLQPLSGDFTAECWVKCTTNTGSYQGVMGMNNISSGRSWRIWYSSNTDIRVDLNGGNGTMVASGNFIGQWIHIAYVKSGSNHTFYVNGTSRATYTTSTVTTTSDPLIIGAENDAASPRLFLNGYISDLRISKSVRYSSNFTPPTEPLTTDSNTSLLISGTDASIVDKSQSGNLILNGNTQSSTSQTKYASSSVYFDGNGDYIRADEMLDTILTTSTPFTIECWVHPLVLGGTSASSDDYIGINKASDGSNIITFSPVQVRWNGADITGVTDLSTGSWYHIALVYDGSTGRYYINGSLDTTFSGSINTALADCTLLIGAEADAANGGSPGNYFNGYLEDLRITAGLARYTSNFTPPTASLEA